MHPPYVVIHKPRGETPLGAIERWKLERPDYAPLPASYAGRLDPMAEGKLLVLLGDECRKQKRYTKLDKEYVIEVVLDLATDTGDVLGLPAYAAVETQPGHDAIKRALRSVLGTHRVPYPAFSSKPVGGTPLFLHALQGTLDTITIPEHDETIYGAKLLGVEVVRTTGLEERITSALSIVPRSAEPSKALGADFRQDVIRAGWRALFSLTPERSFMVFKVRVRCASGTYMRTLASRLAKSFGTTGLTLSITRTKIGMYRKIGPFGFWVRSY
ncbi:MAG TPA: hypothetical protein VGB97_00655 [Candidatus Paceibacterota bacterium]|jgi:tRNA pseudouridine(55) synthase